MADAAIPVLWICGPAGVGKSTASWQLYTELANSGVHVAFADTDQLCMCYPAPAGDPGRQHVKALNAAAVIRNFRIARGPLRHRQRGPRPGGPGDRAAAGRPRDALPAARQSG